MARTDARGGPQTRQRLSNVATRLFLERGFDAVTVADVAREAGVSSVTVFNHFPRKEDLLLDRADDAVNLIRAAIRDRGAGVDVLASLHAVTLKLVEEHHGLAGVSAESVPFFRTVAASPALIARAREVAAELQSALAVELKRDGSFEGDSTLLPAFFIAGYTALLVQNVRRLIEGDDQSIVANDQRQRLARLFDALRGAQLE